MIRRYIEPNSSQKISLIYFRLEHRAKRLGVSILCPSISPYLSELLNVLTNSRRYFPIVRITMDGLELRYGINPLKSIINQMKL